MNNEPNTRVGQWRALSFPGVVVLENEASRNVAAVQKKSDFYLAFVVDPKGVIVFPWDKQRFTLLGAFPNLKSAGLAVEDEMRQFSKFGQYVRVYRQ